jgi:ATP-dependent protease ClpP protease subunit
MSYSMGQSLQMVRSSNKQNNNKSAVNINHETNLTNIHNFNIDPRNREIYLHSYIDENENESGVDYRSAVIFEKNLRYLNSISLEPILVHMHLPGGDWQDCLGIFDNIKNSKAKIGIIAYAKVESSSSVLLQAADLRVLSPNTNFLIHYGSITLDNEHKAALSSVQWSEKESEKMIDIFTEKCIHSSIAVQKHWKKMMVKKHIVSQLATKRDWILDAYEAVQYNFADGILGSKKYPNTDYIKNLLNKM